VYVQEICSFDALEGPRKYAAVEEVRRGAWLLHHPAMCICRGTLTVHSCVQTAAPVISIINHHDVCSVVCGVASEYRQHT
jgi:hypothetical protein